MNAEDSVVEDLESDSLNRGERGPISGDDDCHRSRATIKRTAVAAIVTAQPGLSISVMR